MTNEKSARLFAKAKNLIPGGVNSPVRACISVGAEPLFIDHAEGCRIYDADGNSYIDYVGSWGPLILGHRHPAVIEAISKTLEKGTSFGAPNELEVELAQMIVDIVPSMEMVRMVNSGTEATMSAIRLARGFTGRDKIIKFDGCYHGHADTLLVEAGSGVATLGIPGSPGVPEAIISHTLSLPYNDLDSFANIMEKWGEDIGAVIVEPVGGNMGMVKPVQGFLETLRELTKKHGTILIFDEVMTGFRVALGGAQSIYGIRPDLTCLGKIIGGGLPVGAYGGRRDIMENVAPIGPVYQAGTLSGNPLAMAAGIATLTELRRPGFYEDLDKISGAMCAGLKAAADHAGIPARSDRVGSMMGLFFTDSQVMNFNEAMTSDLGFFSAYYRAMRKRGVYIAPSQFEALFVSSAHTREDIDFTINCANEAMGEIKKRS